MIYIYGLTDPNDGQIHYIGKSNDPERRFEDHLRDRSDSPKVFWLKGLKDKGLLPGLKILSEVSDEDWPREEGRWIREGFQKGWPLTNLCASRGLSQAHSKVLFDSMCSYFPSFLWRFFFALPPDDQYDIVISIAAISMRYLELEKAHGDWYKEYIYKIAWREHMDIREAAGFLVILIATGTKQQFEQGRSLVEQNYPLPMEEILSCSLCGSHLES